ncbi:uncharacterized protein ATNIH1004_005228 [Aspergillus tanneri]|uniref:CMP/dCMP-type deaminase domain-containing protein n=1 Tax=Aspergillus tanneri TaxID=1220188 RepID=A0A5M9N429_9EURO|nr:uncharacterized protein ATNIH1004_005228 [Aspergillus tanneri]KAA8649327.1 hypothetical protein ATNIH1004_005228 [Aspergillus tanneri]
MAYAPRILSRHHRGYMEYTLGQARRSPPAPTKFCVGTVLVDADRNEILSTGLHQSHMWEAPETIIADNTGRKTLEAGAQDMEDCILAVSTA